jgi:hypothetical protein
MRIRLDQVGDGGKKMECTYMTIGKEPDMMKPQLNQGEKQYTYASIGIRPRYM